MITLSVSKEKLRKVDRKMTKSFEKDVARLRVIANGGCQCSKTGYNRCRTCVAVLTLNRVSSDVYDVLEKLNKKNKE